MFRYITNLRALAIDIESFENQYIHSWHTLCQKFKCLFIVPSVDMEREIKQEYPDCYIMKGFLRQFIPSPESHYRVLQILNVNSTEMAYCSKDINFLNRASNFLGGTIWITDYGDL